MLGIYPTITQNKHDSIPQLTRIDNNGPGGIRTHYLRSAAAAALQGSSLYTPSKDTTMEREVSAQISTALLSYPIFLHCRLCAISIPLPLEC